MSPILDQHVNMSSVTEGLLKLKIIKIKIGFHWVQIHLDLP